MLDAAGDPLGRSELSKVSKTLSGLCGTSLACVPKCWEFTNWSWDIFKHPSWNEECWKHDEWQPQRSWTFMPKAMWSITLASLGGSAASNKGCWGLMSTTIYILLDHTQRGRERERGRGIDYIYICVYAYMCLYVCLYIYIYMCLYIYICVNVLVYLFIYLSIHFCIYLFVCLFVCLFVYLFIYLCLFVDLCLFIS